MIQKIEAFAHQELNNDKIKNLSRIENCINLGLDPFDRPHHAWQFVDLKIFPPELLRVMHGFPEFLKLTSVS